MRYFNVRPAQAGTLAATSIPAKVWPGKAPNEVSSEPQASTMEAAKTSKEREEHLNLAPYHEFSLSTQLQLSQVDSLVI